MQNKYLVVHGLDLCGSPWKWKPRSDNTLPESLEYISRQGESQPMGNIVFFQAYHDIANLLGSFVFTGIIDAYGQELTRIDKN